MSCRRLQETVAILRPSFVGYLVLLDDACAKFSLAHKTLKDGTPNVVYTESTASYAESTASFTESTASGRAAVAGAMSAWQALRVAGTMSAGAMSDGAMPSDELPITLNVTVNVTTAPCKALLTSRVCTSLVLTSRVCPCQPCLACSRHGCAMPCVPCVLTCMSDARAMRHARARSVRACVHLQWLEPGVFL